jgi:small conductance mechanosensitive channel
MYKKILRIPVISIVLILWLWVSADGQVKEVPKKVEGAEQNLQELVNLLEDSSKRDAFLKDLKTLIQAQEAQKKRGEPEKKRPDEKRERKLLAIEGLFVSFESMSGRIMDAASSTAILIAKTPEAFEKAKIFFSQPKNRSKLLLLLGDIAGGMVIALIVGLVLRRYIPKITKGMTSLPSKVGLGFVRVILSSAPYGVLLISLFALFKLLPSFAIGHSLALLFFMVLLFYRLAVEVFRVLLSPEEGKARILPFGDENANYYWIWANRFTNFTAFYSFVINALLVVRVVPSSFFFIRGILMVVFPIMISVFILQIAREIRMRYEGALKNDEGSKGHSRKTIFWVFRYWQLLAIGYSWAIFVFLIIQYDKGFGYLFKSTLATAVTIFALFLTLRLIDWAFRRLFAISERVKEQFPGLEEKTNRYIRMIRKVLGYVVVVVSLGVVAQIWGIPVSAFVASKAGSLVILRAIAIFITIGVVVVVVETCQFLTEYLLKEKKGKKKRVPTQKMKTLVPVINTAIKIAAGFIGGIVILDQLGVNTNPILAGAGIVGLAVGFGSQTLVKDLINGLFILFEETVRIGDYVELGKDGGMVEGVGLRTVKLRDVAGNVHVVPNSAIDTIKNYSKDFSRSVLDVGVAYREDVDEVMAILKEIGEEMRNDPVHGKDILEPMEVLGLNSFDDSALIIRARLTTKPLRQWALKREFNRRVKKVFDERGIEIPFPHRTIYMGEPKEGPAPPLQVHLKEGKTVP